MVLDLWGMGIDREKGANPQKSSLVKRVREEYRLKWARIACMYWRGTNVKEFLPLK